MKRKQTLADIVLLILCFGSLSVKAQNRIDLLDYPACTTILYHYDYAPKEYDSEGKPTIYGWVINGNADFTRHKMITTTGGYDPNVPISEVPEGASKSLRLGTISYNVQADQNCDITSSEMAKGGGVIYKYDVTEENAIMYVSYATMLTDSKPDHITALTNLTGQYAWNDGVNDYWIGAVSLYEYDTDWMYQQPYVHFSLAVDGNILPCADHQQVLYDAQGNPVDNSKWGHQQFQITDVLGGSCTLTYIYDSYYKNWTTMAIDLTPYIGHTVAFSAEYFDCAQAGWYYLTDGNGNVYYSAPQIYTCNDHHMARLYLSVSCSPNGDGVNLPSAITLENADPQNNQVTCSAPEGFYSYRWYSSNNPNLQLSTSPTCTYTFAPEDGDLTLYCTVTSSMTTGCENAETTFSIPIHSATEPSCITTSGTCGTQGDNLTWTLDCDGVLTISGTGDMEDYRYCGGGNIPGGGEDDGEWIFDSPHRRNAPQSDDEDCRTPQWTNYSSPQIREVQIADGVTRIGNYAFYYCTTAQNITFAGAVPPAIGSNAFYGCTCTFTVPCGSKEAYVQALGVDAARVIEPQPAFTYSVATSDKTQGTVTVLQEPACDNLTLGIRADANDGYVFKQWSDGNTDNPRSLTLSGDLALTAQFEPITTQLPVVDVAVISQDCSQNGINAAVTNQTNVNGHEYVDLGLPSGLLWAICNVGAQKPEQIGDYYAWGELETKSNYSLSTYQFYQSGYINLGNEISGTQFDVARTKFGGDWRMPTSVEAQELLDNCNIIEHDNGKEYVGSNGKSIFIPKSGYKQSGSLLSDFAPLFWTGSDYISDEGAWAFYGDQGKINAMHRRFGLPVRPVCSKGSSTQSTSTDYTLTLYAAGCETPNTFTCSNGQAVMVKAIPQVHYHFVQWSDGDKNAIRTISVTSDSTLTAEFAINQDIVLLDNEDAEFYTQFAQDYNGKTVTTATLNRRFAYGQWATLCLPFDVSKGMMMALGLNGRVYEFRYAETDGPTIVAYFASAQSIEAGKGYIVNANSKLSQKTSFIFPNVTIDTDADNEDITALTGYNDNSGRGSLYLAGTLRTGRLTGSADGNTYLGLKDNKLYYPNSATGTAVRAYRGFFRSGSVTVEIGDGDEGEPLVPQRVRVMVDGEESGEWRIDNGEWIIENSSARKYIDNGILYIRSNGILFNAQGQRIE